MPVPEKRFTEMALDFVGTLHKSRGYDTILVMTDRLTNYVKIEPTHYGNSTRYCKSGTGMDNIGSVSVRSGPVSRTDNFEMESDRTDRRIDLDRTDFRPISKGQGPTDRSSPCLTIGPDQSVGPIY